MEELNKWIESELSGLKLKKADWGHLTIEDDSRERTLIDVQQQLKILNIPIVMKSVCCENCMHFDKPADCNLDDACIDFSGFKQTVL